MTARIFSRVMVSPPRGLQTSYQPLIWSVPRQLQTLPHRFEYLFRDSLLDRYQSTLILLFVSFRTPNYTRNCNPTHRWRRRLHRQPVVPSVTVFSSHIRLIERQNATLLSGSQSHRVSVTFGSVIIRESAVFVPTVQFATEQ